MRECDVWENGKTPDIWTRRTVRQPDVRIFQISDFLIHDLTEFARLDTFGCRLPQQCFVDDHGGGSIIERGVYHSATLPVCVPLLQCDIGQPVTTGTPSLEETQLPLTHEDRCCRRIVREKYTVSANSMYIVPYNEKQFWFVCI